MAQHYSPQNFQRTTASPDTHQSHTTDQRQHRANLLANLRTGAARGQMAAGTHASNPQSGYSHFTPGVNQGQRQPFDDDSNNDGAYSMAALQDQLAFLQMSGQRQSPGFGHSMGMTQEEAVAEFMRQRQRQQQQQQLQQRQQQHLETLRMQAAAAQQRQTELLAAHQQSLFAQAQAENEQSPAEQHLKAQASFQAAIRTRQIQQLYAQLTEEDRNGRLDRHFIGNADLWQVASNVVDEQRAEEAAAAQAAAQLAATQEQLRQLQMQQYQLQLQQQQMQLQPQGRSTPDRKGSPSGVRSPAADAGPHAASSRPTSSTPRERTTSSADKAVSWRTKATAPTPSTEETSEGGDSPSARSSRSFNSSSNGADDTPQTSEENVQVVIGGSEEKIGVANTPNIVSAAMKMNHSSSSNTSSSSSSRFSSLGRTSNSGSASPTTRPFSLNLSQRGANRMSDSPQASGAISAAAIMIQPCRQPRGPPTDFAAFNFATRMNARTRRDALNKLRLCATPRSAGV